MAAIEDRWFYPDGKPKPEHGTVRRWRVRWRTSDGADRSKSFDRLKDAQTYRRGLENRAEQGDSLDPRRGRITVGDWAQRWLETVTPPILKPKTYASYESVLRTKVLPHWADTPLADVTNANVRAWVAALSGQGLSASQVRQAHGRLACLLDAAIEDERVTRNRARPVPLPTMPDRPRNRYLSHTEVRELSRVSGHPLIPFLAYTGLRWAEAVALEYRDVDLHRRRVHVDRTQSEVGGTFHLGVPKSHQRREVPLPASLIPLIEAQPHAGPLFPNRRGGLLLSSNFRRSVFTPVVKACHLDPLTPHDLRHTAASLAVQAGANILAVARMLGHKDPSVTLRVYADLFDSDLDDVATRLDAEIRKDEHRQLTLVR